MNVVQLVKPRIATIAADEIAKPLPDVHYLCQTLGITSGAPTLFAGYGFSSKTLFAQNFGLAVASGYPLFESWSVAQGNVVHIDHEQGARLTCERYQRLARGYGVSLADLGNKLRVAALPGVYIDQKGGHEAYQEVCEGASLLIIDSLRACAPGADENSSEIRRYLDIFGMIAEKTGVATVVIHHARKPSAHEAGGRKMSVRGSGAIFDACASVFVFSGDKGQPASVSHEKCRTRGTTVDDFTIAVNDVPVGDDDRWGLKLTMCRHAEGARDTKYSEALAHVHQLVRDEPGVGLNGIREKVKGRATLIDGVIDELVRGGLLVEQKGARGKRCFYPSSK